MGNQHCNIRLVVAGLLFFGSGVTARAQTELGVDAGLRTDYLRWNIAAPGNAPNILSELTWKNVDSQYINAHATYKEGDFNLRGDYGYGRITRGDNQDSDYYGNNRTLEFSRSNNKSNGDNVSDAKLGVGIEFTGLKFPGLQITPWVGLSQHQQSLKMTQGFQTIPAYGAFPGLDSTYKANWGVGPWVGIDGMFQLNDQLVVRAVFEYHIADYYGKADWNLIPCFQHPKSYEHRASGNGGDLSIGAEYSISTDLSLSMTAAYRSWSTGAGTDHIFLSSDFYTALDPRRPGHLLCENYGATVNGQGKGFDAYEPLNEVKWRATTYLVGLKMRL